jgi:hypothetical protein
MSFSIKRFNWSQRPTAYQYAEAWRVHRRNMVQQFLDEGSALSDVLVSAQTSLSTGLATLAAQASITRAQQEIKAAQAEIAKNAQLDLSI